MHVSDLLLCALFHAASQDLLRLAFGLESSLDTISTWVTGLWKVTALPKGSFKGPERRVHTGMGRGKRV